MNKNITRRKKLLQIATSLSYIDPDDIPEIDLYMDQLTTFMEDKLNANKRSEEDKTMTKTMINNYTKNNYSFQYLSGTSVVWRVSFIKTLFTFGLG